MEANQPWKSPTHAPPYHRMTRDNSHPGKKKPAQGGLNNQLKKTLYSRAGTV